MSSVFIVTIRYNMPCTLCNLLFGKLVNYTFLFCIHAYIKILLMVMICISQCVLLLLYHYELQYMQYIMAFVCNMVSPLCT